jgi:hypothetical protein
MVAYDAFRSPGVITMGPLASQVAWNERSRYESPFNAR